MFAFTPRFSPFWPLAHCAVGVLPWLFHPEHKPDAHCSICDFWFRLLTSNSTVPSSCLPKYYCLLKAISVTSANVIFHFSNCPENIPHLVMIMSFGIFGLLSFFIDLFEEPALVSLSCFFSFSLISALTVSFLCLLWV